MAFCGQCGTPIAPPATFCGTCGTPLPRIQATIPNDHIDNRVGVLIAVVVAFLLMAFGLAIPDAEDKFDARSEVREFKQRTTWTREELITYGAEHPAVRADASYREMLEKYPPGAPGQTASGRSPSGSAESTGGPWVPDSVKASKERKALFTGESGDMRISVLDTFRDPHTSLREAKRGHTFVWLELRLENIDPLGDEIVVGPTQFQVRAKQLLVDPISLGSGGELATIEDGVLLAGERMTGWIVFEAKEAATYTLIHHNGNEEAELEIEVPEG